MDRLVRNTDLIGPAMCKGADINLGAGGRNIRKQASKNLYTAVGVPAHTFYFVVYYWLGKFFRGALSRESDFFF